MTETPTLAGRHLTSCGTDTSTREGLSIDVLGPLRVTVGGREVLLPSHRQRALLVLFAVNANTVVSADRLVEELWDGAPPPGALVTLRSYISHLRKALGEGAHRSPIVTSDLGYTLTVDVQDVDLVRFRSTVASGHQLLLEGRALDALHAFDQALGLWRGEPLTELTDHSATTALVTEVTDLRTGAAEGRLRALLDLGRHVEAVAGLEVLVAAEPLRESAQELLMLALYRSGRSAEALEVHRRFRDLLRDQLGIDPGQRLDQLMTAVLNRDPRLDSMYEERLPRRTRPTEESATELIGTLIETLRQLSVQVSALTDLVAGQGSEAPDLEAGYDLGAPGTYLTSAIAS